MQMHNRKSKKMGHPKNYRNCSKRETIRLSNAVMHPIDADGIANSEDASVTLGF